MWWQRSDFGFQAESLSLGGQPLAPLAEEFGTPLFVYSKSRVSEKLAQLQQALDSNGLSAQVLYAMKANRFQPLLSHLRASGQVGIDACSPMEVRLARQVGFRGQDISCTATALSNDDLDALLGWRDLWINCDSISVLRRLGQRCPGREVGLRIDPGMGMGYRQNKKVVYAGGEVSKLGIPLSDLPAARDLAKQFDLRITGLHFHAGCGYLDPQLEIFDTLLERLAVLWGWGDLKRINVGGGLGVPLRQDDDALDLKRWGAILGKHFKGSGLDVWVEPGDFLVKDAGVLLCEVTTLSHKEKRRLVAVNAGFNIDPIPAFYGLPMEIVPCLRQKTAPTSPATVVGNLNEALDVFAVDVELPKVHEGDVLAFLNAGGYGAAMASNHCLRGTWTEVLI